MHVVEDKITRTPKVFGYVEFAAVDRPKKALMYSGAMLNANIPFRITERQSFQRFC